MKLRRQKVGQLRFGERKSTPVTFCLEKVGHRYVRDVDTGKVGHDL